MFVFSEPISCTICASLSISIAMFYFAICDMYMYIYSKEYGTCICIAMSTKHIYIYTAARAPARRMQEIHAKSTSIHKRRAQATGYTHVQTVDREATPCFCAAATTRGCCYRLYMSTYVHVRVCRSTRISKQIIGNMYMSEYVDTQNETAHGNDDMETMHTDDVEQRAPSGARIVEHKDMNQMALPDRAAQSLTLCSK